MHIIYISYHIISCHVMSYYIILYYNILYYNYNIIIYIYIVNSITAVHVASGSSQHVQGQCPDWYSSEPLTMFSSQKHFAAQDSPLFFQGEGREGFIRACAILGVRKDVDVL